MRLVKDWNRLPRKVPHPWKHWRTDWMGLWTAWSNCSCSCTFQGSWTGWPSRVLSISNKSMILWTQTIIWSEIIQNNCAKEVVIVIVILCKMNGLCLFSIGCVNFLHFLNMYNIFIPPSQVSWWMNEYLHWEKQPRFCRIPEILQHKWWISTLEYNPSAPKSSRHIWKLEILTWWMKIWTMTLSKTNYGHDRGDVN